MQLSKFTDYAFRVLMYMANEDAAYGKQRLYTIETLAEELSISEHHLKKIIQKLAKTGYIKSIKGRLGGVKLGAAPKEINLKEVLEVTEDNLNIMTCFRTGKACSFMEEECKLRPIIKSSLDKFIEEMGKYTLDDIC